MEILVYYFLELKGTECDPHQWNCSLISSGISKISETRDYKHYQVTAPFLGFSPGPWVWVELSRSTSWLGSHATLIAVWRNSCWLSSVLGTSLSRLEWPSAPFWVRGRTGELQPCSGPQSLFTTRGSIAWGHSSDSSWRKPCDAAFFPDCSRWQWHKDI